jgi:acetyltransferase-like isoleucine patch superfamily enzyme
VLRNNQTAVNEMANIHPRALVDEGVSVGAGTRVWAFSHILSGASIGADCNICDHTLIEGEVTIGDRVTLKSGVYLWDGLVVENDVFIGPAAAFTNDKRPRSKKYPQQYPQTRLARGCSIGANATVLAGIRIGRWAMVGAGSVVTRDVADFSQVYGNPARFAGWVCVCGDSLPIDEPGSVDCRCGRHYRLGDGGLIREVQT